MPTDARDHEHRIALDGGPDGLELHRRVAAGAAAWLRPGGTLLIETSRPQADGTVAACAAAGLAAGVVVREMSTLVRAISAGPGRLAQWRAESYAVRTLSSGLRTPTGFHRTWPHREARDPPPHTSQGDTTHVAVKIRLKRMGKIRQPYYRVVVVDARKKRDGKVIEEIGKYHPKEEPSFIEVVSDRAQYWLGVGAQPSEAVEAILKITGDWQKFKGLPGTEGTLRTKEAKRDKIEMFNEALKDAANEPKGEAVTKKAAPRRPRRLPSPRPRPTTRPTTRPRTSRRGQGRGARRRGRARGSCRRGCRRAPAEEPPTPTEAAD